MSVLSLILFSFGIHIASGRGIWSVSGQYEYYVSPGGHSKPYDDAQAYCNGQGGELALVKTQEVQQFIQSLVADNSGQPYGFFIGIRDVGANGTFIWNDGEALSYKNWNTGEPNNIGSDETCVIMGWIYTYQANLPWYNVLCTTGANGPRGFICQRIIEITTSEPEERTRNLHTTLAILSSAISIFTTDSTVISVTTSTQNTATFPGWILASLAGGGGLLCITITFVVVCVCKKRKRATRDIELSVNKTVEETQTKHEKYQEENSSSPVQGNEENPEMNEIAYGTLPDEFSPPSDTYDRLGNSTITSKADKPDGAFAIEREHTRNNDISTRESPSQTDQMYSILNLSTREMEPAYDEALRSNIHECT